MENRFVTIISFTYPQEAYQAQSYLYSMGIESFLADELTTQIHNFYSSALGGVKIKVRKEDVQIGIDLLKKGGYIIEDHDKVENIEIIKYNNKDKPNKNLCPFCHSENINQKNDPNPLSSITYLLLGALFPLFRRSYLCYNCNKSWKFQKENTRINSA